MDLEISLSVMKNDEHIEYITLKINVVWFLNFLSRLSSAKPLPEPMLDYYQLHTCEHV